MALLSLHAQLQAVCKERKRQIYFVFFLNSNEKTAGILILYVLWLMKCSSGKQSSFHDYRYNMNNFISPAFVSLERPSTCFEIAHTTDEVLATLLTQIAICNIAPSTHKNKNIISSTVTSNTKHYSHKQHKTANLLSVTHTGNQF